MKTVVLGLFDQIDDARSVLQELADSPLDLETIEVLHRDLDVQRVMADDVGLPGRRDVVGGLVFGALAGSVAGWLAGGTFLAALGMLLSASLGALIGGVAGLALGAASETTRVPEDHRREVETAVAGGATALIVRTENMPTAKAIGDLFKAGGSRELGGRRPGAAESADEEDATWRAKGPAATAPGGTAQRASGPVGAPPREGPVDDDGPPPDRGDHVPAIPGDRPSPPDSSRTPEEEAGPRPARAPETIDIGTMEDDEGETIFAPPWRRGAGAQEAVPPPAATGSDRPGSVSGGSTEHRPSTGAGSGPDRDPPPSDTPVSELGLPSRVSSALERADIATLGVLHRRARGGEDALMGIPGVGPVTAATIMERLEALGLPEERPDADPDADRPATHAEPGGRDGERDRQDESHASWDEEDVGGPELPAESGDARAGGGTGQ